jgi:hypothetical protein
MKIIQLRYILWPSSALQLACRLAGVPLVSPLRGSAHRLFSCSQPPRCPEPFLGYSSLSAFIMPLAALCGPLPARLSLCALSVLHRVVGGATMTTPGEACTPPKHCNLLRARLIGFYHRVGVYCPTWLRPFVVDRNIWHFLWYGGDAGDGLRSVGEEALPSSKSVCSILPIAICGPGLLGLRPLYCPWPRFSYPTSRVAALFLPHF